MRLGRAGAFPPRAARLFLRALAAFSEFGGGIALILGLLTPLALLGLAITMSGQPLSWLA